MDSYILLSTPASVDSSQTSWRGYVAVCVDVVAYLTALARKAVCAGVRTQAGRRGSCPALSLPDGVAVCKSPHLPLLSSSSAKTSFLEPEDLGAQCR